MSKRESSSYSKVQTEENAFAIVFDRLFLLDQPENSPPKPKLPPWLRCPSFHGTDPPEHHRLRPCPSTASRKPSTPAPLPPPNHRPNRARRRIRLSFRGDPQRRPFRSSSSASRPPPLHPPPFPPGPYSSHPPPGPRSRSRGKTTNRRRRRMRTREKVAPLSAAACLRHQRPPSSHAGHTNHLCSRCLESTLSSRYRTAPASPRWQ